MGTKNIVIWSLTLLLSLVGCGGGGDEDIAAGDVAGDLGIVPGIDALIEVDSLGGEDLVSDLLQTDMGSDLESPEVVLGELVDASFNYVEEVLLVDGAGAHLAFPDVTMTADDRLMMVYRQGSGHVSTDGKLMKQFGELDGRTWGAPQVLFDLEGMDDRDPSVQTLENGDILVNYFQYRIAATPSGSNYLHEIFLGRSTDNGESFGEFIQVSSGHMDVDGARVNQDKIWVDGDGEEIIVAASSGPVVELGGELLLPGYGGNSLNLANLAAAPRSFLSLYRSQDVGETWTEQIVDQKDQSGTWLMEPAILPIGGDELLMHIRTAAGASPSSPGEMMQIRSTDRGQTWSEYEELGFIGHAPELFLHSSGVLVSAYRWLNEAYSSETMSFSYSIDKGHTWSQPLMVENCGAAECGYPGIIELPSGELMFVFYAAGGTAIKAKIFDVELTYSAQ
jgi:BNR repeat-like domain